MRGTVWINVHGLKVTGSEEKLESHIITIRW